MTQATAEAPANLPTAASVVENANSLAIGASDKSVLAEKQRFAQLQAEMDAKVAAVEENRAKQDAAFKTQGDDPASQLQGLMNAQSSLKRMTSAFASKPNFEKI